MFVFPVSGVELSNPSGETEEKLEEDSGLGILSRETLQIGEDFWCLTHWKGKKKVKKEPTRKTKSRREG